jgi:hypothetical protein
MSILTRSFPNSPRSNQLTPEYKVGDTVQFYKPYRFVGGEGSVGARTARRPGGDRNVRQISKVHYQMGSVERTLDVREAMRLYTGPAGRALANKINNRPRSSRRTTR